MDYSNIPTGLKITTQIPLNVKEFCKDKDTLAYLGVDDNLAFTYHDQLEVLCLAEKSIYIWREVQPGEENTGLVPLDFTYPLGLPDVYGINYSGKKYNFFLKEYITVENINENINIINVGEGVEVYKGYNVTSNKHEFRTLTSTGNSVTITQGIDTINLEVDIEPTSVFLEEGDNVTITGTGTNLDPYIINSITTLEDGITTTVNGDGVIVPYSVEIENLQKTINTFPYTLTSLDDKYTIFIDNGGTNVIVNVPDGLVDNFSAVFIQEGIGSVTVQAAGTATLLYPSTTLQNIVKGQYYWAMIEKKLTTDTYYLLGSLLPI